MIDYRRPVAVTRFVHYFNTFRTPCAWRDVDIYSSTDKETWALKQSFANLPIDAPQVLGIDAPSPARFYKIVVKSLADGATHIETHEIETYYGATIGNVSCDAHRFSPSCVKINVRVVSPDAPLKGAKVRMVSENLGIRDLEAALPDDLESRRERGGVARSSRLTCTESGVSSCMRVGA